MSTTHPVLDLPQSEQEEYGLYFIVGAHDRAGGDERAYYVAREMRPKLAEEPAKMIPAALGSSFRLQRIDIRRGSARIVVYISGDFTVIWKYPDFVRRLESLMRQIEGLLREMYESAGYAKVAMASGWTNLTTSQPRQRALLPAYRSLLRVTVAFLLGSALLAILILSLMLKVIMGR